MRVNIRRYEKTTGLVFRKRLFYVETTVDFSEEEKQVIKQDNRGKNTIVLERDPSADAYVREHDAPERYFLFVSDLARGKPDKYCMTSIVEANAYELELTDRLHKLKTYLGVGAGDDNDKTFEI